MIHTILSQDIPQIVLLSNAKRRAYSHAQPHFWKMAENSDQIQEKYFAEEIKNPNVVALCYENNLGFIIGKIISPPDVYNSGLTLVVDDFCVVSDDLWLSIGKK